MTLTIAAIFESGNKLLSDKILVCSQISVSHGNIISRMQLLYVIITLQTFKELLSVVGEVNNRDGNGMADGYLAVVAKFN